MTAKEIYDNMRHAAAANTENTGYIYWIGYATKNKITAISKMVDRFEEDSDIDYELQIIDTKQHFAEACMVKIMRDSINVAREQIA